MLLAVCDQSINIGSWKSVSLPELLQGLPWYLFHKESDSISTPAVDNYSQDNNDLIVECLRKLDESDLQSVPGSNCNGKAGSFPWQKSLKWILENSQKERSYYDNSEEFRYWILGTMHFFWTMSFRYPTRIRVTESKKAARHGEKMSKSYGRLCRFETCFLRVGFVDDDGIVKLREVVADGSVKSGSSLFD